MRARTRPGRLRALDAWLGQQELPEGAFIDFGCGTPPTTTLELAATFSRPVVGVDAVAHASTGAVTFQLGGFAECARLAPAAMVRAMNVLRGYRLEEVGPAHRALMAPLVDAGLLLEGSTDLEGHVTTALVFRREGPRATVDGLLLHTDFSRGFSPWLFRDVLPRSLRRSTTPGTPLHDALTRWEHRAAELRGTTAHARFRDSLGPPFVATAWERDHGYCRLTLPDVLAPIAAAANR